MNTSILLTLGGGFIIATVIGQVLEHAGKPQQSKLLDLATVMVGMAVILGLLGALFGQIQSVFHVF